MSRLGAASGNSQARLVRRLSATRLWSTTIRGDAAHAITIFPERESVYLGDGWGVSYASARIRRYDLATGAEAASFRSFNGLRCCMLLESGDLLAATDSKLFQLDSTSLHERARWDRRVPRYTDTMAVVGRSVVLANWIGPRIGIIDLDTGRVRRRDAPAMSKVLARGREPLLVGGSQGGGTSSVALPSGKVRRVSDTPSALDAALSPDANTLWMLTGVRAEVTPNSTSPGRPTSELRGYPLDGESPTKSFALPLAMSRVAVAGGAMLLANDGVVLRAEFTSEGMGYGLWKAPKTHYAVALEPEREIVITVRPDWKAETSEMSCWTLRELP